VSKISTQLLVLCEISGSTTTLRITLTLVAAIDDRGFVDIHNYALLIVIFYNLLKTTNIFRIIYSVWLAM